MYQVPFIFSSCDNVNLTFVVGELRNVDGYRAHRPVIRLDLLGSRFWFDRRRDFVKGKIGCCAGQKFLLGLQGLIALSFAKLLQAILNHNFMVYLELRLDGMLV